MAIWIFPSLTSSHRAAKIKSYAVGSRLHQRVYNYIKKHLDQSLQAYIVCPLVEEGESELAAAQEYAEKLQKGPFLGYRLGLLHGRMKPRDKEETMRRFAANEIQLLVSTTVVEVGVDVPNAVVMVLKTPSVLAYHSSISCAGAWGEAGAPPLASSSPTRRMNRRSSGCKPCAIQPMAFKLRTPT